MQDSKSRDLFDVVIAGGGPVGLFLACELRLGGASVLVLEREQHPQSPLKELPFGRRGLTVPTIEMLDRRGLLDDVVAAPAQDAHPQDVPRRHAGHFAGIPFDEQNIDRARWPWRLPGPADRNAATDMARLERVLAARADVLGAEIRRGVAVEGVTQAEDGVTVHAIGSEGAQTIAARWLVGCDGGRSTVRKAVGVAFPGTEPAFTGYSVRVDLADPQALKLGRHTTPAGLYFQTQPGHIGFVEFDGGAAHRTPLTLARVQAALRRVSGTDVTLAALHVATTWTDRAQQATTYRAGRVLLAGDAAHIHAPLGGQGLNLGLGDGMNLGWKLAATIRGDAPDGLLGTYTTERHPICAAVLDWSRAQVALLRPDPAARALTAIVRDLVATRDGATYFAERVWAATLRTDFGHDLGGGHELVGRSVPDFVWADGTRVSELMRDGRCVLLDFEGRAALRDMAGRWGERVRYMAGEARERLGLSAVLVRPDGVVAWACEGEPDRAEAAEVFERWFVAPADKCPALTLADGVTPTKAEAAAAARIRAAYPNDELRLIPKWPR